jgi:hypothetical protein
MSLSSGTCAVALKEWATVLRAMARGEQCVLIRKGGLIEPGAGFELKAPEFACYPTFEHQAVKYLRAPFQSYFEDAASTRPPHGTVRVELIGQSALCRQSTDPQIIKKLEPFHIYNDEFLTQRLKWQPDQPLTIVVVRAYLLEPPEMIQVKPQYAGCTSWVDLEVPVRARNPAPAMAEPVFAGKLRDIAAILER